MKARVDAAIDLEPGQLITDIVDNIDRPGHAEVEGVYATSGTHKSTGENKWGERIPKVEAYAAAGVGRAAAQFSVYEAEANGPNAKAGAYASVLGAGAMASAELASASARAGPVGVKVGVGVDTGARIGPTGAEAKFLGTGFKIGPETSISLLNSEVSCCIQ